MHGCESEVWQRSPDDTNKLSRGFKHRYARESSRATVGGDAAVYLAVIYPHRDLGDAAKLPHHLDTGPDSAGFANQIPLGNRRWKQHREARCGKSRRAVSRNEYPVCITLASTVIA